MFVFPFLCYQGTSKLTEAVVRWGDDTIFDSLTMALLSCMNTKEKIPLTKKGKQYLIKKPMNK